MNKRNRKQRKAWNKKNGWLDKKQKVRQNVILKNCKEQDKEEMTSTDSPVDSSRNNHGPIGPQDHKVETSRDLQHELQEANRERSHLKNIWQNEKKVLLDKLNSSNLKLAAQQKDFASKNKEHQKTISFLEKTIVSNQEQVAAQLDAVMVKVSELLELELKRRNEESSLQYQVSLPEQKFLNRDTEILKLENDRQASELIEAVQNKETLETNAQTNDKPEQLTNLEELRSTMEDERPFFFKSLFCGNTKEDKKIRKEIKRKEKEENQRKQQEQKELKKAEKQAKKEMKKRDEDEKKKQNKGKKNGFWTWKKKMTSGGNSETPSSSLHSSPKVLLHLPAENKYQLLLV